MRHWCVLLTTLIAAPTSAWGDGLPLRPPKNGGVYVVAHRGAHNGIPENSLAAYQKAIDLGCDFIEIDLRTTKDGKFVSMHNREIDAYIEGATGLVAEFTLAELRALDIGKRVAPEWEGTRIPTFEEILDLCKGKIGIYLDLKSGPIEELAELIEERGMEHDVLWYISSGRVKKLREVCPECIAMPDPGAEKGLPRLLERVKPRVVAAVWRHYSPSFVEKCHAAGAIVIVDESDPDCWEDAVAWGSDGVQTDHPEAFIEFLKQRAGSASE
ncbi:MAG: hypothetical protein GWP08_14670 [Nitrospiraceae bacterium]|nr:hypothetical protein [Nitrospiraceae bacterium]